MDEEFRIWLENYGEHWYSNKYVFFDSSRPSGLTGHGEDLLAAYIAGRKLK